MKKAVWIGSASAVLALGLAAGGLGYTLGASTVPEPHGSTVASPQKAGTLAVANGSGELVRLTPE